MKCDELTPIDLECNMGKDINGVVHREPWKAYDIDEVDEAIAELKSENKMLKEHIANGDVSRITWIDEVMELKAKLENAYATVAFNHLDAVMRERRLQRALWLARAERAIDKMNDFAYAVNHYDSLNIEGSTNTSKGHKRMLDPCKWYNIFEKVEHLCRRKAEEYK